MSRGREGAIPRRRNGLTVAAVGLDIAAVAAIAAFMGIEQFDTWITVIAWILLIVALLFTAMGMAVAGWRRDRAAGRDRGFSLCAMVVSVVCLVVPTAVILFFLFLIGFFPDSLGGG